jgi:glutaconate CoA-transferase subunit B
MTALVIADEELIATDDEMMMIVAARELRNGMVCFVGIGMPSTAANLARHMHAPDAVLIYESGTIGAKPTKPPLSIGDGELADTAVAVVSVPEIFTYWLQAGRIDVGFLGAAQLDKYGNINSTVVGDYDHPKVRLPGAGGAPEIAGSAGEIFLMLRQNKRAFVEKVDFLTSVGNAEGGDSRQRMGMRGKGPSVVITDIGVLRADPMSGEFVLAALHEGKTIDDARAATGWDLRISEHLETTAPATVEELRVLRALTAGSA